MEQFTKIVGKVDDFVWGPYMLLLLVGTGVFLTFRTGFLSWRNLMYALKSTLSKEARKKGSGEGDISPFSALTTALAATIGTGNIVGVATAMVLGGPGAIVWMWISACFGLTSKFSECMLSIKYREVNENGEMSGGPMFVMKKGFKNKKIGAMFGWLFAAFTILASFGIGNLAQANSISSAINETAGVSTKIVGVCIMILAFVIVVGGIQSISKVSSVVVPFMAVMYVIAGIAVIIGNYKNVPDGIVLIFKYAFHVKAATGGVLGAVTASMMNSMRYGIARGVFSNEAGMGSAAITASAATTNNPVRQAYINMTGTFWDTMVVCSITGLCIASSGVLGTVDAKGEAVTGAALTIAAFRTVLGEFGAWVITVGIALFAFSTILGWEYHGEKAFEYLLKTHKYNIIYRVGFSMLAYIGATTTLKLVWNISDIANALMAVPNLICMLVLSGEIAKDMKAFEKERKKQ